MSSGPRLSSTLARRLAPQITALSLTLLACERPPVGPVDQDVVIPPGRVGPVAIERFVQDRPAIAGKWYDYDPTSHLLEPLPHAWIVRDALGDDGTAGAPTFTAFRIVSIYDDRAESGLYTLAVSTFDGDAWSPEETWVTPRHADGSALCVDVRARAEAGCHADGWHLRLTFFRYFSPQAAIAVANPGIFVRSVAGTETGGGVRVARIDDVGSLDALPNPTSVPLLADEPAASWDETDWAFDRYAPDLPEAGMAIGPRFVDGQDEGAFTGRDDVYWLVDARLKVVRFRVRPIVDGDPSAGLRFSFSRTALDREDFSIPEVLPEETTVDVALPSDDGAVWLHFEEEALLPSAAALDDASWPHAPPPSLAWHLAVERVDVAAGPDADRPRVRLLVSPAAAVWNATAHGVAPGDIAAPPPVSSP